MKNGRYFIGYRLRTLTSGVLLCACVVAGLIVGGCRSSRSVVEKTETIEHNEYNASEKNDSVHGEANDSIHQRDTIRGSAGERGRIDIERDTAGRPIVIVWAVNSDFSAEASTETLKNSIFDLRNSSNNAEASGSVDSFTEKEKETKEEVKVGIPLECLIGWSIVALLILFYTGDYIYRLWKKRHGK